MSFVSGNANSSRMTSRLKIGHLILIFALAALPFAATYILYYPDERHYTDGALMMLRHGHWLVPENADGSARFVKPPLAYWAIAASWSLFGINTLTARLPFLLASCGTLLLIFKIAKRATGNDRTALLASVVLASQPQFFLCSVRDMPDALLTFFITLSCVGFLRLIVWEELTPAACWMAYGGATGAAMSKGMLGIVVILFAWAFTYSVRRRWSDVLRIIHWPGLAVAVLSSFGWIAYIVLTHGKAAWQALFGDQVSSNLHEHFWSPLWRVPVFAVVLIVNFLPWSLPVFEQMLRTKKWPAVFMPPSAYKFILAWTLFLLLSFSMGTNLSTRYLLPAAPLMSILLAAWLQRLGSPRLLFSLRRIFNVMLAALFFVMAASLMIGWGCRWPIIILAPAFILLGAGVVLLWHGASRKSYFPPAEALGLALLFVWLMVAAGLTPLVLPDGAEQIAISLRQLPQGRSRPVLLVGDLQLSSRLRVELGKDWVIAEADKLTPEMTLKYTRFLLKEPDARTVAAQGWPVRLVAVGPGRLSGNELIQALRDRSLRSAITRRGQRIYLNIRE